LPSLADLLARSYNEHGNSRRPAALLIASLSGAAVVKISALVLVIVGIVIARQAYAEPASSQPSTRSVAGPEVADRSGQPLTRSDCDKAGMRWNDSANVCGEESGTHPAAKMTSPVPSTILITIDKT
jgi:hypothetical protein